MGLFSHRPDHDTWKPHANADTPDDTDCYQAAADKLGITIKISYPCPCSAGADLCAGLGMRGIYILRSQASRESELTDEYFRQQDRIAS